MRKYLLTLAWLCYSITGFSQDGFIEGKPRLAYWLLGSKPQVVIVLHGGAAAQHWYLRPEFDALQESARIIYYDQRGCGESERDSSYLWQDHVTDLHRLIKTLSPLQKVVLAGSSWGSLLAMLYAYSHPEDVKGLILTGTVEWKGREESFLRNGTGYGQLSKLTMQEKRLVFNYDTNRLIKVDTITVSKQFEIQFGSPQHETLLSMQSAPKPERLRKLRMPILIFSGTSNYNRKTGERSDWLDQYVNLFPHAQFHTLNMAGHDPWLSDPNQFFTISNQFIRTISQSNINSK
ncbi:alpha/beta fold hydrolase [Larkinella sp.]|uniref:alpha/beta fold hydrolase n=1 Tax=Larkinella sp. TaxID=2034517 RepID=UPI003BA96BF8